MDLLNSILSSETPVIIEEEETLSIEQFAQLTSEIELLRTELAAGKQVSLEDARKIVVWFRARRKKNFTVVKEKAVKEVKPKAPSKRGTRKTLSAADQQALADAILNSLP